MKDIPDPKDPDPIRYTFLASLTESMVIEYNHKISIGMRRGSRPATEEEEEFVRTDPNPPLKEVPYWAAGVPAVDEWVTFLRNGNLVKLQDTFGACHICVDSHQLANI